MTQRSIPTALVALTFAATAALVTSTPVRGDQSPRDPQSAGPTKAVLVTGASSGIGRMITEVLASEGYFVYAGARSAEDLGELNQIPNVESIRLDVTQPDEIDAAVAKVRAAGRGLHGLVNNAGVGIFTPLIETTEEDFLFQFNVNVMGPYRVTKAFAPLIIESHGRITTIGSINGIIAGTLTGPYAMTKHAMEAFADALASEMARFEVQVSLIEPGRFRSNFAANVLERMERQNQSPEGSQYEQDMRGLIASFAADESRFEEPRAVAEAVTHALFSENPKARYLVTPSAGQARATIATAIQRIVQMNADQPFSLDRATLISILDAALEQQ